MYSESAAKSLLRVADGLVRRAGFGGRRAGEVCVTKKVILRSSSATRTPPASPERIDDGDPLNLATVVHVFGIEFSASKRASRRDDGAVPVGKPVRRFD